MITLIMIVWLLFLKEYQLRMMMLMKVVTKVEPPVIVLHVIRTHLQVPVLTGLTLGDVSVALHVTIVFADVKAVSKFDALKETHVFANL